MADTKIEIITLREALEIQADMDTTGLIRNKTAHIVSAYAEISKSQNILDRHLKDLETLNIELFNLRKEKHRG